MPASLHRIRTRLGVPVAMRDGVRLSTDVYLPDAPGPFPVILIRTPYSNNTESYVEDAVFFAQRGYAVAIQDVRGRYDSEGEWSPFVHEAQDGYDAQEWCGTQPWSTGKVGTSGGSYVGLTQLLTAPLRNRPTAIGKPVYCCCIDERPRPFVRGPARTPRRAKPSPGTRRWSYRAGPARATRA